MSPDREQAFQYLLGELGGAESEQFEESAFSSADNVELVRAFESELVDAYATNELDQARRTRFEAKYLTNDEGRERVANARALRAVAAKRGKVIPLPVRWAQRVLPIAALVIAVIGATIFALASRTRELRVALGPESVRAGRQVAEIESGTSRVVLALALDGETPRSAYVVSIAREGREVQRIDAHGDALEVVVEVPGSRLLPGKYEIALSDSSGAVLAYYALLVRP